MTRYEVHGKIGMGGAATVHVGRVIGDGAFERVVAIKRLRPEIARTAEARASLIAEAVLVSRINHPNVVPVLDIITEEHELFAVMDYVHGETLNRLLRASREVDDAPPPIGIALAIAAAVLRGLHAAHEARGLHGEPLALVHRDVTPQNVVVGTDGSPRLLDFGIAKALGRGYETTTGEVKGKLGYMAPEQLYGEALDRRTDIFAVGVILCETLTGTRLFRGATPEETIAATLAASVSRPSGQRPEVPSSIDDIVLRALSVDPSERFPTASEMATAIERHEVATASELGAWVERVAAARLVEKSRLLEAMKDAPPETVLEHDEPTITDVARELPPVAENTPRRAWKVAAFAGVLAAVAVLLVLVRGRPAPVERPVVAPATFSATADTSALPADDDAGVRQLAPPPPADRKPAHRAPTVARPGSAGSCTPPFVVEPSGRKHYKPECF